MRRNLIHTKIVANRGKMKATNHHALVNTVSLEAIYLELPNYCYPKEGIQLASYFVYEFSLLRA
jgi:hypothetical protein